jgi:integrase
MERKTKPRTFAYYEYMTNKYIKPKLGSIKLAKLSPLQVQGALDKLMDSVSPDLANKIRRLLFGAMRQAVRWQLVARNPVDATEPFKHEREAMKLWTPLETWQFLEAARTNRLYAFFYLVITAGLRSGELKALKWGDLKGNVLHVQRSVGWVKGEIVVSAPKTEKGKRRVMLDKETLEVLSQHRKQQESEHAMLGQSYIDLGLIFSKQDGGYITPHNLEGIWYRLLESSKVPKVRIHDLRHLNVSLCRKQGQDAKLIADQVGHTDPAFTVRQYTHLFQDDLDHAALTLSTVLPKGNPETNN